MKTPGLPPSLKSRISLSKTKTLQIFFICGISTLLTLFAFFVIRSHEKHIAVDLFDRQGQKIIFDIENALKDAVQVMPGIEAFYNSSLSVTREEFATFTKSFLKYYPFIQSFQWVPLISDEDRPAYEEKLLREGLPHKILAFDAEKNRLGAAPSKSIYYPVHFMEPVMDAHILNVDLDSLESRKIILEQALLTKKLTVSPILNSLQESNTRVFLTVIPIFHETQCKGFILGVFNVKGLMEPILKRYHHEFSYMALEFMQDSQVVYATGSSLKSSAQNDFPVVTGNISVANQMWRVRLAPLTDSTFAYPKNNSLIILLFGIIVTVLLMMYLNLLFGYSDRVEKTVKERTYELERLNQRLEDEIFKQKQTEETLKETARDLRRSEEKFRSLVTNIPGAVYRCSPSEPWTTEYISANILDITGYPFSDFVENHKRSPLSLIHPDDREEVNHRIQESLREKRPYVLEYRILHADGSTRWVHEKGQGIFDDQGNPFRLDGIIFDISDKKNLEQQIFQTQKLEAIGKMAGGIAHDFNNQLMVITGYCTLLLGSLSPESSIYQEILEIKTAADKSSKLTRQLLALGRRQMTSPKILNVNECIENVSMMIRSILGGPITLKLDLFNSLPAIKMDPHQLEQVLLNFVMNARDAMPEGGTLTLRTSLQDTKLIRPYLSSEISPYVVIEIRDTGAGMSDEVKSHLFEPFFTTKDKTKGSGLGLATNYSMIQEAKGWIEVESALGQGTAFKILLPSTEVEKSAIGSPMLKEAVKLPAKNTLKTILLVDDEPSVRELTSRILRGKGYEILEASSGQQALDLLSKEKLSNISLLITDIMMPGMTGKELAQQFKKLYSCPIIFISGYADNINNEELEEHPLIQKPFAPQELIAKVQEVLNEHAA